jgi:ATP-dependent RNA helicase DDX19/DBP5
MQILHVVQRMGEYTPVECFFAGKDSFKKGMPKLTAQIVIGTPGTMIDVR